MGVNNIVWLRDVNKNKIDVAGAKGAYLADLYGKNFPVTNGFIISAEAFKEFMRSNNLDVEVKKILKNLNPENLEEVSNASEKIKNIISKEKVSSVLESEILEAYENLNVNEELLKVSGNVLSLIKKGRGSAVVAVRSSSVFDIPGSCDNFLSVAGSKNLMDSIKKCWGSLYSAGNILNMKKNDMENSLAVIVQKMVDANKSGIVLSSNPMNRENEMIIEAGFGLGQLITRGEITPDLYIVSSNLEIKEEIIGRKKMKLIRDINNNELVRKKLIEEENKKVLQGWEIEDLARLAQKIERIYNKPVVVEFGIGKKIEIFHVRLFDAPDIIDKDNLNGKILLEGRGASPKISSGIVDQSVFVSEVADSRILENLSRFKGVVVNQGSLGSCSAILCRQHNIPFVIAENSTAILNHGLLVTIDGVNGRVYNGEAKEKEERIKKSETEVQTEGPKSYGFEVLDL